ncbi:MAG: cytochrome c [Saprospiraceae bacterium]|nr:cytochrome c [Saprospiraceae bacterium]
MWIRLLFLVFCGLLVLWGCGESSPEVSGPDGQAIYTQNCVFCHGADGRRGLNGAGDLTASTLPLELRKEQITNGKGLMTPYKNILTPEEIDAVARFTLTLTAP